jgi:hypothetical protein
MIESSFQRNQLVGALHALLNGPTRTARTRIGHPVAPVFLTRVKRLLESDLAWATRHPDCVEEMGLAFFDQLPDGTGSATAYSPFNAFCLGLALQLVHFGLKQGEVVEKIATIKDELRAEFERTNSSVHMHGRTTSVRTSSKQSLPSVERVAGKGDTADHTVFLLIMQIDGSNRLSKEPNGLIKVGELLLGHDFCHGYDDLHRRMKDLLPKEARNVLVLEIGEFAARIVELLEVQVPVKRGRK